MWLTMERRAAHLLNVLHDAGLVAPDSPGRRSLILVAAHTCLPEASVLSMPSVARSEMALGLRGPLRKAIAFATDDETALDGLRDELLMKVGAWCDVDSAVGICDALHVGRALRRESPMILGADLIRWYHHYRGRDIPHYSMTARLERHYDTWVAEPRRRQAIEAEMYNLLLAHSGGEVPPAFLDRDL